jgi:hypothetical protein
MQTKNFSNEQVLNILNALGSKLCVRINRAGNIDVVNPNRTNEWEHFVLYFTPNKRYLWRRWFNKCYAYPLNMKGRKRIGEIHREKWGDKEFTWYSREWDITNCEFDTVDDALNYYKKYMEKYHNVNL